MVNRNLNKLDWKTGAIIVLAIAVAVLFYMQLTGNQIGLSPGQYEEFKEVNIKTSGDHARLGIITDASKSSILKLLTNQVGNNGWLISREPTNNDLRFYSYGIPGEALRVDYDTGDVDVKGNLKFNGKDSDLFYIRDLYLYEGDVGTVKIHGTTFGISIYYISPSNVRFSIDDGSTTPLLSVGQSYNIPGLEPTVLIVEGIDVQEYAGGIKRVAVSFD